MSTLNIYNAEWRFLIYKYNRIFIPVQSVLPALQLKQHHQNN